MAEQFKSLSQTKKAIESIKASKSNGGFSLASIDVAIVACDYLSSKGKSFVAMDDFPVIVKMLMPIGCDSSAKLAVNPFKGKLLKYYSNSGDKCKAESSAVESEALVLIGNALASVKGGKIEVGGIKPAQAGGGKLDVGSEDSETASEKGGAGEDTDAGSVGQTFLGLPIKTIAIIAGVGLVVIAGAIYLTKKALKR